MVATSTDPAHARMWESSVPAVAFGKPVASHAMMAFSAFCLSSMTCLENTAYDFQATAELHYCQSLEYLRASLPILDQISADAVLACAMVLIPCGLALAQSSTRDDPRRDWLYHLRGFKTLGSAIYGWTNLAEPADQLIPYPQLGIPDAEQYDTNLGGGALWGPAILLFHRVRRSRRDAMQSLRAAIDETDIRREVADTEACTATLTALEYVMDYTLECRVSNFFRAVFTWPIRVSPRYVELLMCHDHLALAIYAHWLVLTIFLEDLWWVKDFGADRIDSLASWVELSDSSYSQLLRWPVKMRVEWRGVRTRC
ncbi:transcription factor [Taxawa tesnikishii (nom. ined.)]|nr:transcription factor [Dothideales sp. JES 119]